LRDVAVRRFGYGLLHAARVPEEAVWQRELWGSPCEIIYPPVVARCGVTLRSVCIVTHSPIDCRVCMVTLAGAALIESLEQGEGD
jgi:hypothetical protein